MTLNSLSTREVRIQACMPRNDFHITAGRRMLFFGRRGGKPSRCPPAKVTIQIQHFIADRVGSRHACFLWEPIIYLLFCDWPFCSFGAYSLTNMTADSMTRPVCRYCKSKLFDIFCMDNICKTHGFHCLRLLGIALGGFGASPKASCSGGRVVTSREHLGYEQKSKPCLLY